ncbi:MAG TPA: tRNA (N(6)-L-threonylcarbamoyladenosine(37)-C(2))-methylthiotransferase MtaB [Allosphingosinicella sp.]
MSGPEIITMGCRLNLAESEAIRRLAAGQDDLIVVNSCAVTNEAVRQTRQAIRRAKRSRPEARVFVTGCAAQVEPGTFAAMPEVERVLGNRDKLLPTSFVPSEVEGRGTDAEVRPSTALGTNEDFSIAEAKVRVSDIMAVAENAPHLLSAYAERSRAFIEVQNGCDHRCTFCIIPYGRGNSRSVPAGLIVERVKALVGEGVNEVVLTGVDVTSYGPDLPGAPTLGLLIERILRHVPELQRLRLSSLDCIELDERLFDLATGEPRFMPHLHMSFQAGDDMVLKRMKRRHLRADAVDLVARLKAKRPEIAIGADLIAGFPTETDAMHANSLKLIDECDIVMGHIFPYSPKAGTPAARMPQVAPQVVKERARALREASARRRDGWLAGLVGTRQRILLERGGLGHTESFAPVRVSPPRSSRAKSRGAHEDSVPRTSTSLGTNEFGEVGQVLEVLISGVEGNVLMGSPA